MTFTNEWFFPQTFVGVHVHVCVYIRTPTTTNRVWTLSKYIRNTARERVIDVASTVRPTARFMYLRVWLIFYMNDKPTHTRARINSSSSSSRVRFPFLFNFDEDRDLGVYVCVRIPPGDGNVSSARSRCRRQTRLAVCTVFENVRNINNVRSGITIFFSFFFSFFFVRSARRRPQSVVFYVVFPYACIIHIYTSIRRGEWKRTSEDVRRGERDVSRYLIYSLSEPRDDACVSVHAHTHTHTSRRNDDTTENLWIIIIVNIFIRNARRRCRGHDERVVQVETDARLDGVRITHTETREFPSVFIVKRKTLKRPSAIRGLLSHK